MPALAALPLGLGLALATGGDEPYHRVLARALERAQTTLASKVDFAIDHSRWEDPWVLTSAHYEVRTTQSYGQALELSRNLEYFHGEFVKLLGEGRTHERPAKVWVFPTIADYNRFGNEHGAEHSSMLGSFFAPDHPDQPVASYQSGNFTQLGMWITHSALHQFVSQAFGRQPEAWVDEGLASYFALFWNWEYGASQLATIQKDHRFVPLERLVTEPIQAYVGKSHERFIELGMLYRYLLEDCESTKSDPTATPPSGPFQEFLRASVGGPPASGNEFRQIFESDAGLIEEDFRAFDFAK